MNNLTQVFGNAYLTYTGVLGATYYKIKYGLSPNKMNTTIDALNGGDTTLHAPQLLSVIPGDTTATLMWSNEYNFTNNIIMYGTQSGQYTSQINVTNTNSYTIQELKNDTTYYIVVADIYNNGIILKSNEISVTPLSLTPNSKLIQEFGIANITWPDSLGATFYKLRYGTDTSNMINIVDFVSTKETSQIITNITAVAGDSQIQVNWNSKYQITNYIIKYGLSSGQYTDSESFTQNSTTCSYIITNLLNGVPYYFTLDALYNNKDNISEEHTATPLPSN